MHPFGFAKPAAALVRDSITISGRELSRAERRLMRVLRWRLDLAAPAREIDDGGPSELVDRMRRLLDRALEQTPTACETDLYDVLLGELVPDEARMLAALSDRGAAPVVYVYAWSRAGLHDEPVLQNALLLGRMGNVSLPDLTPVYVRRLLTLGLVAIGPEEEELQTDYEILMAEDAVRAAIKEASQEPLTPSVARHSLRLSELGARLWQACDSVAT